MYFYYYRKTKPIELKEVDIISNYENDLLTSITLKNAIDELPYELREIILLRFANELQVNEIAIILGISRFAVMHKIKKHLMT